MALFTWKPDPEPEQSVPDLSPQPSQIMAEPATPAACQRDYADAADVRDRLDKQLR